MQYLQIRVLDNGREFREITLEMQVCVRGWGRLSFDFEPNSGKNPADSLSTAGIKTGNMESTNGAGSSSLGLE